MPIKKLTGGRRGRPKSAVRGLDYGTPEMQRHRRTCLRLGNGADLGGLMAAHPVLPIDLLYRRGAISQRSWENALSFHRFRQKAQAAMLAPHDVQCTLDRLKGRSCQPISALKEWRALGRWRALCARLSWHNPQIMVHMDRLLDSRHLMDYPYLSPDALQKVVAALEALTDQGPPPSPIKNHAHRP